MQNYPSYITGTIDEIPRPSFFANPQQPRMTDTLATQRAERYDWALGERSPGPEELYDESISGREENFRARRSLENKVGVNLRRQQLIQNYLRNVPNMTETELKDLQKMDEAELEDAYADPNTFYERQFAKRAVQSATVDLPEDEDVREPVGMNLHWQNQALVNQGTARKFVEEAELAMKDQTTWQSAKMWIPFYRWSMLSSNYEDPTTEGGFLLNKNMKSQIEGLYHLRPDEFYKEGKKILDNLREENPELALQFAHALLGYSSSDEFLDFFNSALDLTVLTPSTVIGTALGARAAVRGGSNLGRSYVQGLKLLSAHDRLKTMTRNLGGKGIDYSVMLPEYRKAHAIALDSIRRKAANTGQVADWDELVGMVPSILNPRSTLDNSMNMSAEAAARLEIGMLKTANSALDNLISRPKSLRRLSPEQIATATSEAEQFVKTMYAKSTLGSRISNVVPANRYVTQTNALANTDALSVYLEKAAGGGYASEAAAKTQASKLGLLKYDTEQVNGEWYIKYTHYVDENTPTLQSFARPNDQYLDKPHTGFIHGLMSRVKSRNTLVPDQLMQDLLTAQAATNGYFRSNRAQFLEDFSKLGKNSRRDLEGFMQRQTDFRGVDSTTGEVQRGKYNSSVSEFEKDFSKELGRMPTENEIATYFSWVQWNDADLIVRSLDLTRDMVRLGVQKHQLKYSVPGGPRGAWSPDLEGKVLNEFPWDRPGDAGILVWDSTETWAIGRKDHGSSFRKTFVSDKDKEYINTLIERDGYRVLQLSPWSKGDLVDFLKNWGGAGTPEPKPYVDPLNSLPSTKGVDPELAKKAATRSFDNPEEMQLYLKQTRDEIQNLSKLANTGENPIVKEFGRLGVLDPEFRDKARGLTNIVDRANAIADRYVTISGKANTVSTRPLPQSGDQTSNVFLNKIISAKLNKITKQGVNAELNNSDVQKLISKAKSKTEVFAQDQQFIDLMGKRRSEMESNYKGTAAAKLDPNPYNSIDNMIDKDLSPDLAGNFNVITASTEKEFIEILSGVKKPKSTKLTEANTKTPYVFLSEPGSTVTAPNHIILNGPIKGLRSTFQNRYPDLNFMTVAQAKDFIKKGKIPQKPLAQRAEEAAQQQAATTDLGAGDVVYRMSPEDKKELAKSGTVKGAEGGSTYTIREVFDDTTHGKYVFLEGENTGFPAEDLYLVQKFNKGPENYTKYMSGTEVGRFDYILIKPESEMRSAALDFKRFNRQQGGHKIIEDEWHIRQPQVYAHTKDKSKVHTYEGDQNAYTAVVESDAREVQTHLENIRGILKDDFDNGTNYALHYYNSHLDGMTRNFKEFKKQFKQFDPKNGHLDLDTPFVVTPRDQSAWNYIKDLRDVNNNPMWINLQNHRDNPHNLFYNELNLQFAMERSDNLDRIVRAGTKEKPIFGTQTTGALNPMAALSNSMSQLIRGRVLDDLKIKTAHDFARAYSHVIDAPLEQIHRDPMDFILNPKWKQGLKGEDEKLLNAAKDFRRAYIDFMGIESPGREFIIGMQRKAADSIKKKMGQGSYDWVDRHLLRGKYYNPVRWANNVVYDLFFGVYNIKQLVVQGMSAFHAVAVSPRFGVQAGFAQWLARPLLFDNDPARLAYWSKYARAFGMRPDHFREAVQAYKNSGWHIIGAETAFQDDFINQNIKESFIERSRQMGRVFFKEGDRVSRGTGYMTAYMEWRNANPIAKLTPEVQDKLLLRADDLTLNMTSASQAAMAKGIGNIPLKFTTYYLRMMEQLLPGYNDVRSVGEAIRYGSTQPLRRQGGGGSGRLTPLEKMRAYGIYSAAFGVPITASGAFGLWPVWKEWEKYLIENGYDTDQNLVLKAFNGGLAEILPSVVGLDHNFSEALGPTGSSWMYDIVNGRNELFDIVTGVGGEKISDTFSEAWPFFTFIANAFRNDDEYYPLQWSDLELFARSISSVNNVYRAIQMYNTGIYMSKNQTRLASDQSGIDAAVSIIFGSSPKEMQKAFLMSDMTKATKGLKQETSRDILRYHRLKMKAIADGDIEKSIEYGKAIKWLVNAAGFMPHELNKLFSDTINEDGDFIRHAEKQFYSSTPERQRMYLEMIKRKKENN